MHAGIFYQLLIVINLWLQKNIKHKLAVFVIMTVGNANSTDKNIISETFEKQNDI